MHMTCPACSALASKPLSSYQRAYLERCSVCGFVFAGRRPTSTELGSHYGGYSRLDYDSPITRLRYRELLERFSAYRECGRILDVGCGVGYFLEEAHGMGWEPHGTEYGERAVAINREKGFTVADAARIDAPFKQGHFDVITAFEVLEHVPEPRSEMEAIARMLRPGGLFYCTTPNFGSLSRRLLGPRWSVIDYPEHLNYFTARTLVNLAEKVGLAPTRVLTTGISVARLRRAVGLGTPDGPHQPSVDERLREHSTQSRLLAAGTRAANAALSATRTGDTLKGWFELRSWGA
jgi:SAM-dependent methyltransferase